MFENVSWGEMNFTDLINAIIDFVLAIVRGEWEELDKILGTDAE